MCPVLILPREKASQLHNPQVLSLGQLLYWVPSQGQMAVITLALLNLGKKWPHFQGNNSHTGKEDAEELWGSLLHFLHLPLHRREGWGWRRRTEQGQGLQILGRNRSSGAALGWFTARQLVLPLLLARCCQDACPAGAARCFCWGPLAAFGSPQPKRAAKEAHCAPPFTLLWRSHTEEKAENWPSMKKGSWECFLIFSPSGTIQKAVWV